MSHERRPLCRSEVTSGSLPARRTRELLKGFDLTRTSSSLTQITSWPNRWRRGWKLMFSTPKSNPEFLKWCIRPNSFVSTIDADDAQSDRSVLGYHLGTVRAAPIMWRGSTSGRRSPSHVVDETSSCLFPPLGYRAAYHWKRHRIECFCSEAGSFDGHPRDHLLKTGPRPRKWDWHLSRSFRPQVGAQPRV